MKKINKLLVLLVILLGTTAFAQKKPFIYGVLIDENHKPIEGVNVYYADIEGTVRTTTDKTGFYKIELPVNRKVIIWFEHISFALSSIEGELGWNDSFQFNSIMVTGTNELRGVLITSENGSKRVEGLTTVDPEVIIKMVGPNAGVENIIKSIGLGVTFNNELSTQYSVRGGNYDENLVYVNDVEIYRPFLIRSGQQEGLSFTNSNMVKSVDFSSGGFQSRFGDKLSSVLDIKYRKPTDYAAALEASFLGGSLTLEGVSKDKKWAAIVGARYRDNSLLVNSQETQTNYKPTFADVQTMVTFTPNEKWDFSFIGNISQNQYNYQPLTRQTNFGTVDDPIALQIFYEGQEKDQYKTYFGAFTSEYKVSDIFRLKFIGSAYHTQEQEHFDILAQYALGNVDTSINSETFGACTDCVSVGSQLNHGRNDLDALIVNAEVKGYLTFKKKHNFEWGVKYTREDIRDRLVEWEVIDSAGFSLRPPVNDIVQNDQPYTPYKGPLVPYQNTRATNFAQINRFSGYGQWSYRDTINNNVIFMNAGVRAHQWQVTGDNIDGKSQIVVSPRAQFAIKPNWGRDMVFRLSGGLYYQPPFYRELRDSLGVVQPNVKAQRSIHVVLANDYSFKMGDGNRPFKLVTEAYYKKIDDVNTYTLENVRIRYRANNDAVAYAYGLDMRLNGEFVPGTESWISFGYMRTEENINGRGYIPRPTDQRLKFGLLFQDYVPNIPNLKMYLNLVYNTGLPGGSPSYADSYVYQSRLNDYRRADAGFAYVFKDIYQGDKIKSDKAWLKPFQELTLGLEIFNLFNNQNAITNTWVRDVYSKAQYGIPNYLTSRVFSLKLSARI